MVVSQSQGPVLSIVHDSTVESSVAAAALAEPSRS
jgi:hypothetical protein